MEVIFETQDPEAVQYQRQAVRRIHRELRRLNWLGPRARVHLCDVNGPGDGVDKRCRIEVVTDSAAPVVITAMAHDWRTALHSAVARLARTLIKNWQCARDARPVRRTQLNQALTLQTTSRPLHLSGGDHQLFLIRKSS